MIYLFIQLISIFNLKYLIMRSQNLLVMLGTPEILIILVLLALMVGAFFLVKEVLTFLMRLKK